MLSPASEFGFTVDPSTSPMMDSVKVAGILILIWVWDKQQVDRDLVPMIIILVGYGGILNRSIFGKPSGSQIGRAPSACDLRHYTDGRSSTTKLKGG